MLFAPDVGQVEMTHFLFCFQTRETCADASLLEVDLYVGLSTIPHWVARFFVV